MKLSLALLTLTLGLNATAQVSAFSSQYSTVDLPKCLNYIKAEGEGNTDVGICEGPQGILLDIAAGEWTNMKIAYKDFIYGTWEQMIKVGSGTGVGGDNRVVEWVSKDGQVYSLIARVRAFDAVTAAARSSLMVFGFNSNSVCLRGYAQTNKAARALAQSDTCIEPLKIEGEREKGGEEYIDFEAMAKQAEESESPKQENEVQK